VGEGSGSDERCVTKVLATTLIRVASLLLGMTNKACYDFEEDVDLPFVFSKEMYDDNYQLWRQFCASAFGVYSIDEEDITNLPNGFPKMKYNVFEVYYKIDEKLELHGPFMTEEEAHNA
jgi:hypothetical protein